MSASHRIGLAADVLSDDDRAFLEGYKRHTLQIDPLGGIASLPGFVESLRLLVVREQYTDSDIGLMFGVTRERIRQLVSEHQIAADPSRSQTRTHKRVRVWDDDANCFRPVGAAGRSHLKRRVKDASRHRARVARAALAVAAYHRALAMGERSSKQPHRPGHYAWVTALANDVPRFAAGLAAQTITVKNAGANLASYLLPTVQHVARTRIIATFYRLYIDNPEP